MIDFTWENMLSWHPFFFPSGFSIDQWMPLDEFVGQPFYEEDHMSRKVIEACVAAYEDRYSGFTAHQLTSKLDGQSSLLYYDCSSGWTCLCASQGRLANLDGQKQHVLGIILFYLSNWWWRDAFWSKCMNAILIFIYSKISKNTP
jgi:hypothetical protein